MADSLIVRQNLDEVSQGPSNHLCFLLYTNTIDVNNVSFLGASAIEWAHYLIYAVTKTER